jgi:hypothetical protein
LERFPFTDKRIFAYVKTNDQTKTRLNPVSFIHSPGKLSVKQPATAWRMTESTASPHNWQRQGRKAPRQQGEQDGTTAHHRSMDRSDRDHHRIILAMGE